ncbi:MAG: hypothetical protein JWN49_151 [Parcubacteria group bacterium]|nr:hypothetical protein [Parcubacteria group bacterium]
MLADAGEASAEVVRKERGDGVPLEHNTDHCADDDKCAGGDGVIALAALRAFDKDTVFGGTHGTSPPALIDGLGIEYSLSATRQFPRALHYGAGVNPLNSGL